MTITYTVGDGIYINLTNRCTNNCSFCIRNNGDGAYGSDSLWLDREPDAGEVLADLKKYNVESYKEIVFCGYGEPTMRLDILLESARLIKEAYNVPIRLNTNGLGNLINKKDISPLLGRNIDIISISLNAADAQSYYDLCLPEFGLGSFEAVIEFGRLCSAHIKKVMFSVVRQTLSAAELEKCGEIARGAGVELRIRELVE